MIFITRIDVPAPLDMSNPESVAAKEFQKLVNSLVGARPPVGFNYRAYSSLEVRNALRTMFHGKCAYCESPIAGSQDTDIEHYRPKGKVTEADAAGFVHPGYWWLAMRWDNLLLSCSHCNQTRIQVILPPGLTEAQIREAIESGATITTGKLDRFPTDDGLWVTDRNADLADEKPLLINPTRTDPNDHLEWVIDESISTLRAKEDSRVGQTSIDIFGLNRRWLTEARMQKLLALRILGNKILARLDRAAAATDETVAEALLEAALEDVDTLEAASCGDSQPYAALSRAYLVHLAHLIAERRK